VPYLSRTISSANFLKVLRMLNVNLSAEEQAQLFASMVHHLPRPNSECRGSSLLLLLLSSSSFPLRRS
jgi:hypothetical protein